MSPAARRWTVRGAQSIAGLVVALAVAEGIFWWRDHGAFPHVNFYVADATLGARLRPGATERISFGGNPVTRARVNREGFRGADLPAPGGDEVLIVGDSQVFGLGVEEDATFSARLAAALGRPVVNAGVPTYGPEEYGDVIAEVLPRRHPKAVVYVVNLANDLFEASHPNRERHVIWDGWAIRRELAPPRARAFPGRAWLFGQSHLVYALRRLIAKPEEGALDRGLASEGTWTDILDAQRAAQQAREAARREIHDRPGKLSAALVAVDAQQEKLEPQLYRQGHFYELAGAVPDDLRGFELEVTRSAVGDILSETSGEEERALVVTAGLLRQAATARAEFERNLRQRAEGPQKAAARSARKALDAWAEWQRLAKQRGELVATPARFLRHQSPLLPHIQRAKALCDAAGARLYVVALPMDVMVSPAEWKKYGASPTDLGGAHILVEDLVRASEEIGVSALDATAALAAAEPGAFLDHDLHMSARGHAALAGALAAKLGEPPPLPMPTGGLPPERERLPASTGWSYTETEGVGALDPLLLSGLPPGCQVKRISDWVRVFCQREDKHAPSAVTLLAGGHGDGMTFTTDETLLLLAPVMPGDKLQAEFRGPDGAHRFEAVWKAGASEPKMAFRRTRAAATGKEDTARAALEAKLAKCVVDQSKSPHDSYVRSYLQLAANLQLTADADCERTYPNDCQRLVECARGDVASPPECPPGQVNAGVTNRCHALCGPGRPCAQGACVPWPGTHICE